MNIKRQIMDPEERKLNQRIIKRKEKVKEMIDTQQSIIDNLDPSSYHNQSYYFRALSVATRKLHRLQQELVILESGRLAQDV